MPRPSIITRRRYEVRGPTLSRGSLLETKDFVSHGNLLRIARRNRRVGIHSEPIPSLARLEKNFWVFKATVYKSAKCRGFVGQGDAHPGNVSPLIFNHSGMRVAETRAVNRAHVTVYGVALCSLEVRPPWPLSPEQLSVLRRTLQYRPPFQKGVLPAAPTNSSRFRRVVSILAGLSQKNPRKCQSAMYTCSIGHD